MSKPALLDPTAVAYSAGLFDGEGCIHIGSGPLFKLQVSLTNTSRPVLDWFQGHWGGALYDHPAYGRKRWTMCWTLTWSNTEDRSRLLSSLLPHLIVKRRAAELALHYLTTVGSQRGRKLSPLRWQVRKELHEEWKDDQLVPAAPSDSNKRYSHGG